MLFHYVFINIMSSHTDLVFRLGRSCSGFDCFIFWSWCHNVKFYWSDTGRTFWIHSQSIGLDVVVSRSYSPLWDIHAGNIGAAWLCDERYGRNCKSRRFSNIVWSDGVNTCHLIASQGCRDGLAKRHTSMHVQSLHRS